MGCNCKKKYDILRQYSDSPVEEPEKDGIFWKILVFFARIIVGILLAPLIIVIAIPFLGYVIICLMFGIDPTIKLKIPFKKKK